MKPIRYVYLNQQQKIKASDEFRGNHKRSPDFEPQEWSIQKGHDRYAGEKVGDLDTLIFRRAVPPKTDIHRLPAEDLCCSCRVKDPTKCGDEHLMLGELLKPGEDPEANDRHCNVLFCEKFDKRRLSI